MRGKNKGLVRVTVLSKEIGVRVTTGMDREKAGLTRTVDASRRQSH